MRLLDPRFKYIPAVATNVEETWRRFGFRPTTLEERRARQPAGVLPSEEPATTESEELESMAA